MPPKVSLFASAIRTESWQDFHNKIAATNKVPFEIVFVGPRKPEYYLPEHLRFIQCSFKPAQCSAIAAELCRSEVMLQVVDDIEYSPGAIDQMYDELTKFPSSAVTCHYFFDEEDCTPLQNVISRINNRFPLVPVCGMFSKSLYQKSGGLDRRFIGVMWELDLYSRFHSEHHAETRFVDAICREKSSQNNEHDRLCYRTWNVDRTLFLKLWNTDAYLHEREPEFKRMDPLLPYDVGLLISKEQS